MLKEIAKVTPIDNADLAPIVALLESNGYSIVGKRGNYVVCENDNPKKSAKKPIFEGAKKPIFE